MAAVDHFLMMVSVVAFARALVGTVTDSCNLSSMTAMELAEELVSSEAAPKSSKIVHQVASYYWNWYYYFGDGDDACQDDFCGVMML